jgi:hypothetical protein
MSAAENGVQDMSENTAIATESPEIALSTEPVSDNASILSSPPKVEIPSEKNEPPPETSEKSADSWLKNLSKELQTDATLARYKNLDDVAKAFLEQRKLLAKRTTDLKPDELGKLLNVPEKPEDYQFKLEEGLTRDEGMEKLFQQAALNARLSPEQANKAYSVMAKAEHVASLKAEAQLKDESIRSLAELKRDFGAGFDAEVARAQNAIKHFGENDALLKAIDGAGLGSNPTVVKAFAEIGRLIANDQGVDTSSSSSFQLTPSDAARQIDNLMQDAQFQEAFYNDRAPNHKQAVEQMMRLRTLKNPGSQLL